jgi:6-phosphogluconolactonase
LFAIVAGCDRFRPERVIPFGGSFESSVAQRLRHMTSLSEARLEILDNPEVLARRVADWLLALATAKEGRFAVALSGGSTPRRLYELLARPPYRDAFPWGRTHWFWGDERFVPRNSPDSNYRMVQEAMLAHVPVPTGNVHPIATENLTPDQSAIAYERDLKDFYGTLKLRPDQPLFDVTFLGLGPEGHIASLFPGTAVLKERSHWTGAVIGAKAEPRITLTYPALESSSEVAFLVAGAGKRPVLEQLFGGDEGLPAAHLHPVKGELRFFLDRAAAPREAP